MSDERRRTLQRRRELLQQRQQLLSQQEGPQRNPDGTYGEPPEGYITDTRTGGMTSRELMAQREPTRGEAVIANALRGLSFGGSDEAMGAIHALVPGDGSMRERYEFGRDYTRAREDATQEAFPVTSGVSEAAGGVGTALSYGLPAIAGRGLPGAMAAGAGVGAAEGGAYGFLSGEGGAGERGRNALSFGALGGVAGAAAPVVMRSAGAVGRGVADTVGGGVDRFLQRGSQTRANRAIGDTVERSGQSIRDIDNALRSAMADGQPEFRAADALGFPGQRRLSAIVRSGGDASDEAANFLRHRQIDQPERVAGFVEDAFDAHRTAADTERALRRGRSEAADAAYDAARGGSEPVDVRGAISAIDDRIGGMQGSGVAGDGIDARLAGFRRRLAAPEQNLPDGTTARELSDFDRVLGVKQDVQDAISAAQRAGRNNEARELTRLSRELDAALETASPAYREANDQFARQSRVIDSVEEGQRMARPGQRADDTVSRFQEMSPDEQAAARTGYGDAALRRLEAQAGEGTNRARQFTSTKAQREADALAIDPEQFGRRIDRENVMASTRERALGGSRTADNLADMSDLQPHDLSMIANIATGRFGTAAQQASGRVANLFSGMNPQTRQLVADAMLSNDTQALRRAVAQVENSQQRQAIMETASRIGAMQTGGEAMR